jgi:hypothetical protein
MAIALTDVLSSPKFRVLMVTLLTCLVLFAILSALRHVFTQSPSAAIEEEIRITTESVGKLMELPAEKPTVATVKDVTKLSKTQPFFSTAKNGDIVLFYNQAKKAILYRPTTNKIITVAPITVNTTQ